MKNLLLASSAMMLIAGGAFAQTLGTDGVASVGFADANDLAVSVEFGSGLAAAIDGTPGSPDEAAVSLTFDAGAAAGADLGLTAAGAAADGNLAEVPTAPLSGNYGVQFQLGNRNQALNIQLGDMNSSAILQVGNRNDSAILQDGTENAAAASQFGDDNVSGILQEGVQNAAASTQDGDLNSSFITQQGNHNAAASTQLGQENLSVVLQNNGDNMAANLQDGTNNTSFISQGAGLLGDIISITGFGTEGLPVEVFVTPTAADPSFRNAAASIQLGSNNVNAIIQDGNRNEAVNIQSQF